MHSSSPIVARSLLDLPCELRMEVISHLPMEKQMILNLSLVCRRLRTDVAPFLVLWREGQEVARFVAGQRNQKTSARFNNHLRLLPATLPARVTVPHLAALARSLVNMASAEAAASLRCLLAHSGRIPPEHAHELKMHAMRAALQAHVQLAGNSTEPAPSFEPADDEEARLALQCLLDRSFEDLVASNATPARLAAEIELHAKALGWAARQADPQRRGEAIVTLVANFAGFLVGRGADASHLKHENDFVAALLDLIPRQDVETQSGLLHDAFTLCKHNEQGHLIGLALRMLHVNSDAALHSCWKSVVCLTQSATRQGCGQLGDALLQRALAFKEPAERLNALEVLAEAAYRNGHRPLMRDSMQAICVQSPPGLADIRALLARLDTPVIRACRLIMTPCGVVGLSDLMQEYARIDVRQLLTREILPRLRVLTPDQRMLAALEVSECALGDFFAMDERAGFRIFYREMLEAVFHDQSQWTAAQQQAGRTLIASLRAQAEAPQRPHLLAPDIKDIAGAVLNEFKPG